jgi:SAM-dependent methyltransferase
MAELRRWRRALDLLDPRALAIRRERCPICGGGWQVRLKRDELGVRCTRCGASAVSQSLAAVIRARWPTLRGVNAYELSASGPIVSMLQRGGAMLTVSEFDPAVASGTVSNGVRFEDVERLSFAHAAFDLITNTEVFEHVEDDARGFRECARVLKPGGEMLFTVPLSGAALTIERAHRVNGILVHHLPPTYHADRRGPVLCMRDYGRDLLDRLRSAGFAQAEWITPPGDWFGFGRIVIAAQRGGR